MIDHLRQSLSLAAREPGGALTLAALAVSALAACMLLGARAAQRDSKGVTVTTSAVAAGGWLGSVGLAVRMVRDGQGQALRLWHHSTAEASALSMAAARAESGHALLALTVLAACVFCVAWVMGGARATLRRGAAPLPIAIPAVLALLTGTLAYGLFRRIDLTYYETECLAATLCTQPVISGTVELTDKLRTLLLVVACAATLAALLAARRLGPATKRGLAFAAATFLVGAGSWSGTRSFRADASAPLPERKVGRVSCPVALASADSVRQASCSACLLPRRGPVIEVLGAELVIDGKSVAPDALSAERSKHSGQGVRLPPPSVLLVDPHSDAQATARSLAQIRDRYGPMAELALREEAPRTVRTQTAGTAELPAQCCCIRVTLEAGTEIPRDWSQAVRRAAQSGKLVVGPAAAGSGR